LFTTPKVMTSPRIGGQLEVAGTGQVRWLPS